MVRMKDGTEADDSRLGRLREFDERSRNFPIRALVSAPKPRSHTWRHDHAPRDQGNVGACVSYMLGHQALARPGRLALDLVPLLDRSYLLWLYCEAQRIDPWPGTDGICLSPESPNYGGTSVLAGLKIGQSQGMFDEYRWAFGVYDAALGMGYNGPSLLGTWWRADMNRPASDGRIRYSGSYLGGHAYLGVRIDVTGVADWMDGRVWILNSWGLWGQSGYAWMTLRDLARALDEQGECAFAVGRKRRPKGFMP